MSHHPKKLIAGSFFVFLILATAFSFWAFSPDKSLATHDEATCIDGPSTAHPPQSCQDASICDGPFLCLSSNIRNLPTGSQVCMAQKAWRGYWWNDCQRTWSGSACTVDLDTNGQSICTGSWCGEDIEIWWEYCGEPVCPNPNQGNPCNDGQGCTVNDQVLCDNTCAGTWDYSICPNPSPPPPPPPPPPSPPPAYTCPKSIGDLKVDPFWADPNSGFIPLNSQLYATYDGHNTGSTLQFNWNCGNGQSWADEFTTTDNLMGTTGAPFNCRYTAAGTYNPSVRMSSSSPSGTVCNSTTVTVTLPPPPTVDLKLDSQDGPLTKPFGSTGNLTWTSSGADSCEAFSTTGDWFGAKAKNKASPGEPTGAITSGRSYTLTCSNLGGNTSDTVIVNIPPPTVDLKINGSDGPITVVSGATVTLTWTSTSAASCTAQSSAGDWSGAKPVSNSVGESTGSITTNRTYTITCNNTAGTANDEVFANIFPPNQPPVAVASISKDGTTYASSITVTQGVATPVYLSAAGSSDPDGWTNPNNGVSDNGECQWNSDLNQGAPTYETTVNNPASPTACNISLGTLTFNDPPATYTYQVLRIIDAPGAVSNIATVSVTVNAPPLPPSNLVADNSTCSQISLTWQDNSSNEDGFRLYVNKPGLQGSSNLSDYTLLTTRPPNSTSYTYSPPTGQSYSYAVTAFNTAGESTAAFSLVVFNNPCAANLTLSSKCIDQVNGLGDGDPFCPWNGPTLKNGDLVTFKIIISNGGTATAYDVYVVDTLTPTLAYQAGSAELNSASISESIAGQTITWNAAQNLGDLPASTNWVLTYEARLTSSSTQVIDFFDNSAVINYQDPPGTPKTYTPPFPLTPFRTGQSRTPDIKEIAP